MSPKSLFHFLFCLVLALIGFSDVSFASGLIDLDNLDTGTHQFTDEGGQPLDAHVENINGTGWLLVGRGRQGWDFDNGGPGGTPAEVLSGLGTTAAFVPKALSATTINALITEAGIDLTQVEIRLKRSANSLGTLYQQELWRPIAQETWTWDLDPGYEVKHEILEPGTFDGNVALSGTSPESQQNTRDNFTSETNDHRRLFTFPFRGHNLQQGFSYGLDVRGSNDAVNFLWENDQERHGIPYTEVYIRDNRDSIEVTNIADSGPGSLRDVIAAIGAGGAITFDPSLNGATINLRSELEITRNVSISASSLPQGLTIRSSRSSRIFRISSGTTTLTGLEITDGYEGVSGRGGGILVDSGATLLLERSTLTENFAGEGGGAIFNIGTLRINQCTFVGNRSFAPGVDIYSVGPTEIVSSTFGANTRSQIGISRGGSIELTNSIIVGNEIAPGTPVIMFSGEPSSLVNGGGNLIGSNVSISAQFPEGPLVGTSANPLDPGLLPLANNGGPTRTMRLTPLSPARDNGLTSLTNVATPFTDQRGFERVLGNGLDIGAYESAAGNYSLGSLTIFAELSQTLTAPFEFEIADNPNFTGFTVLSQFAGSGNIGNREGPSDSAEFSYPSDLARDEFGNFFIADTSNNRIRLRTFDGQISTIAGNGNFGFVNGAGPRAEFALPAGLKVGPDGNVYVADTFNHSIRKLTRPTTPGGEWTVSTLAGSGSAGHREGRGTAARFSHPYGLAFNLRDTGSTGGDLYVADSGNNVIRRVTEAGTTSTFAGSGVAGMPSNSTQLASTFDEPFSLAFTGNGQILYIADRGNHVIRKLDLTSQLVTTLAGSTQGFVDGSAINAAFHSPVALAIDAEDNLYVSDEFNHAIRKINISNGAVATVTTVIGTGNPGSQNGLRGVAQLDCPSGLLINLNGEILIADTQNHQLRSVSSSTLIVPATVSTQAARQAESSAILADIDFASLGLEEDTTYYFRWRAPAENVIQITGQSFQTPGSPFAFWQALHFGPDASDPTIAGPTADPNGDHIPNLLAYASGRSPFETSSINKSRVTSTPDGFILEYSELTLDPTVTYRVESSTDLVTWIPVSASQEIISSDAATQRVRVLIPVLQATGPPAKFVRIAIERP